MNTQSKWTFMVFLAGDNNLSTAGDTDLREMRVVGSTPEVNVVAEFDNAGTAGTRRYHIQRNGIGERTVDLGETDSGSPDVLLDFVRWAAQEYPAERYALILWNHGNGWIPTEIDRIALAVDAKNYGEREATERSASPISRAFFRTTLEQILSLETPTERAICCDDGTGHSLDTLELGRVLDQIVDFLGQPLDLLGMDACLMSNLEVAYQTRGKVEHIVASEESEPNNGWPYDRILRSLVQNPSQNTSELAASIVNAYVQSYVNAGYNGDVTQSALNVGRVQALTDSLDALSAVLIRDISSVRVDMWTAQRQSVRFYYNTLWDIGDFCTKLAGLTTIRDVRSAAERVVQQLQPGADRFVIAEGHNGTGVRNCTGVSVYFPTLSISQYYGELDFALNFQWYALLKEYLSV